MILAVFTHFIHERGHLSAGQRSGSFKEIAEFIHDQLVMLHGACLLELILILIAHPAQCGSRKSGSQTALNGIAGIVEAARNSIACMAGTPPGECGIIRRTAAHVRIIKVQRILQQFCIVIQLQVGSVRSYCHSRHCRNRSRHRQNTGGQYCRQFFL